PGTAVRRDKELAMHHPNVGRLALAGLCLLAGAVAAPAQEAQWKAFVSTGWRLCREGDPAGGKEYLLKALQQADGFPADDPRRAPAVGPAVPALGPGRGRRATVPRGRGPVPPGPEGRRGPGRLPHRPRPALPRPQGLPPGRAAAARGPDDPHAAGGQAAAGEA